MKSKLTCSHCGSHKHTLSYCPKTWNERASALHHRCVYCGSSKHDRYACSNAWPAPRIITLEETSD